MAVALADYLALTRGELAERQRRKLATLLETVRRSNGYYQRRLADLREPIPALADLPLTTRAEIERDQGAQPPYGTLLTYPLERYVRIHQTSGSQGAPLRWLDTRDCWRWWQTCWGAVYDGANATSRDVAFFAFSFGPFIGFWSAFETATARGLRCLAGGGMSSEARLRSLLDHGATLVCCTPTYALRLAEVARERGLDLAGSAVRALIVAGEPGGNIPATRAAIEAAWGARVFDHAGMTEIGAWGFEDADAPGALTVLETEFIAEALDPAGTDPVADGELGELVLTNLGRLGMPLIRYRTGDLVRLTRTPAGRTPFARALGGVLGRADDMIVVRGNNVFPAAIEGILREIAGVAEFRIEARSAGGSSELTLVLEPCADADAPQLERAAVQLIRDRLHFRPLVRSVPPGSLARFEMKARRVLRM